MQQLSGAAGVEHLADGAVEGIGRGMGEHLDAGGELALGFAHGWGWAWVRGYCFATMKLAAVLPQ
jgi:hypothetical protein